MKKTILLLTTAFLFQLVIAQQPMFINNPYPKTISVSGSAEMEVTPDEIYVNVELSEYQKKATPKKISRPLKQISLNPAKQPAFPIHLSALFLIQVTTTIILSAKGKRILTCLPTLLIK